MQDFNIELPKEVLTPGKHNEINFDLLEGKVIVGLMGYSKSGKDFIAKTFIDDYGYQRVAFADNIKKEMNKYLKEAVCEDINARELIEVDNLSARGALVNWRPWTVDKIDFFTEDLDTKKVLRPYIIWYGEKLRTINGKFCWINRALEEDAKDMNKIVLSDVRRLAELDVFKSSNEYKKRFNISMAEAGIMDTQMVNMNNFGTLLLEVNQFGLTDSDKLTIDTIQYARENWMIDDTFYVDSRVPNIGTAREKSIKGQIKRVVKKFGIEKPAVVIGVQTTIFNS